MSTDSAGRYDAPPMEDVVDYKVRLENFYGPLDLLLHLVKESEVEIQEIPIAVVAHQYVQYIEMMQKLDINLAGDFLVMASTMMEIKARLLAPVLPCPTYLTEGCKLRPQSLWPRSSWRFREEAAARDPPAAGRRPSGALREP